MKIFEGKSPTEKKKIIAAMLLGVMALLALTYTFGGMFFPGKKTVTVNISPTPTATASPKGGDTQISTLPPQSEIDFYYETTPVIFTPPPSAPDAGRNIFAFYEPPPPTPYSPTPLPPQTPIPTPTPTPAPPQIIGYFAPQSVYAGSKSFLLEINGDKFTPETRIIFNGNEMPTTYVNPQRLTANIPSNFIAGQGQMFIYTRSVDGKLYSNQVALNVQAPPTPQFQYIGMLGRQKYNNDTAYFVEPGKDKPFGARLNDPVGGRFRLISISSSEVILEDINLGFKHRLALYRPASSGGGQSTTGSRNEILTQPVISNPTYPTIPVYNGEIPGIPSNIPRFNPNNPSNSNTMVPPLQQLNPKQKTDEKDEDGDN